MTEQPMSVDLTNCDREPIHIPGAIQPHGVLLALESTTWTVSQASENTAHHLGRAAQDLIGRPLSEVLERAAADRVRAALTESIGIGPHLTQVSLGGRVFDGIVHQFDGAAILELEPTALSGETTTQRPLSAALQGVQHARSLAELTTSLVEQVQRLTGFERVLIYQFDEDDHGSVIAEAKLPDLEPYLGLHYPASDIPRQARQLYLKNWLRLIPDARYAPARLVPPLRPDTGKSLDLSYCVLRSVSPIHLEYLANMGVRASMSISIVVRDRLWGLISCANHSGPRYVPYELRAACEALGRLASLQITAYEDRHASEERASRLPWHEALTEAMRASGPNDDVLVALLSHSEALLGLVGATGAAVINDRMVLTCGRVPDRPFILSAAEWLAVHPSPTPFASAALASVYPPAVDAKDVASGLLTFLLPGKPQRRLMWFRPEVVQTVNWGGDPRKPASADARSQLHPRRSFELWKEEQRLRSRPWSESDCEAAVELRRRVIEVDLERQVVREQKAIRARDDLVAVVSHDLRNPLNVIQMQAALLLRTALPAEEEPSRRLRESSERIQRAIDRMNALIHDLLDLATIEAGRFVLRCRSEDIRDVIDEALLILRPLADTRNIKIREQIIDDPAVRLDRERFYQLLSNIVGNAIKFTPEGGSINIRTERQGNELLFTISDTGPGIAQDQLAHVFDRYWQARNRARQGSGLGLYISKGIVEAHGGVISVESPPGSGAIFRFTVPLG